MRAVAIVLAVLLAAHPSVERAQRAYSQLRFEDVLKEIAAARKAGNVSRADDLELTRLEAFTYAVYDDEPRAVDAFGRLLALQPSWTLPADTSPKIRRYFQRAQAQQRELQAARAAAAPGGNETPPFYVSGWFWGALGLAVAAGVGAGIVLLRDEPDTPRGNLGTLELP